jgi:hypothetical protein
MTDVAEEEVQYADSKSIEKDLLDRTFGYFPQAFS